MMVTIKYVSNVGMFIHKRFYEIDKWDYYKFGPRVQFWVLIGFVCAIASSIKVDDK